MPPQPIELRHMVRGHGLGIPIAIHTIGPLQLEALRDVPFVPWWNGYKCLEGDGRTPPFVPSPDKIREHLERLLDEDTGRLFNNADFVYLDIEGPMGTARPRSPGLFTLYADCIYELRHAMRELSVGGHTRIRVGIYALLQQQFRRGTAPPNHLFHAAIDPFVDVLVLSGYNTANRPTWEEAIAEDLLEMRRYLDYYNQPHVRNGRPIALFLWRFSTGRNAMVPLDRWTAYAKDLIDDLQKGDIVVWFGAAKHPFQDQPYAEGINALKRILSRSATKGGAP